MNPMLRLLATLTACLLALGLVTSCGTDEGDADAETGPVTLEVTTQGWTGWSREQPEPETHEVTVSEGDTFEVHVLGGPATFTVVEVRGDELELESDESFSVRDGTGSGFSLTDTETEFEVNRPGRLELVTPTMDAGTTVTLRLA